MLQYHKWLFRLAACPIPLKVFTIYLTVFSAVFFSMELLLAETFDNAPDVKSNVLVQPTLSPMKINRLSDEDILRQFDQAIESGTWRDEKGAVRKTQIHDILSSRYQKRFPFIPDILWHHIMPEDWIVIIRKSYDGTPDTPRMKFHPANPRRLSIQLPDETEASREDNHLLANWHQNERTVILDGGEATVLGRVLRFPPVSYTPPEPEQTATQVAETLLSAKAGQEIHLGPPIGGGGMRFVYFHPTDPDLVIKAYEPILITRMRGTDKYTFPMETMIAYLIQRELAIQNYLIAISKVYEQQGTAPPPYEIAPIVVEEEFINRGIIIQKKVKGFSTWKDLPQHLTLERLENLDRYFEFHSKYNQPLFRILTKRYNLKLFSVVTPEAKRINAGIDLGANFGNFFLREDGVPILIDW